MDGTTLLRTVRELLQESSAGTFMNDRTTYDYLYEGALEFNLRAHFLTSSQSISVSAGTAGYNLNADYVGLAAEDSAGRPVIKFTISSQDYFLTPVDFSDSIIGNATTSTTVPTGFYIQDATGASRIAGTATSSNTRTLGESTLADSAADFTTVAAGDLVHNTTDGSNGVVVAVTNTTSIICALFEGSDNQFDSGDSYIILPQTRYKLVLDPPPSATATITVNYIQRPTPVYAPYRAYKLPFEYATAIAKYAASQYKFKDRDPAQAQYLMGAFDNQVQKAVAEMRRSMPQRQKFHVDLMSRGSRSNPRNQWGRR